MSAKVMDYEGIKALLRGADGRFPRLSQLWLDAGYRAEDKGAHWVRKALGWSVELVERPKKPAPEEVLMAWAREWAEEGVAVDWRKLLPPKGKGLVVLPRGGGWWSGRSLEDRSEQEDEQRLREVMCERRSVGVRCHDSPHDEAARPCLRTFHTVSPGSWVNRATTKRRKGSTASPQYLLAVSCLGHAAWDLPSL
jgi:hypothetical protein